jgi:hypothetical protein
LWKLETRRQFGDVVFIVSFVAQAYLEELQAGAKA